MSVFRRFFRRRQREADDGPEATKQAGAAEEFMREVSPSELMSTLLTVRGPEFVQALGEAVGDLALDLEKERASSLVRLTAACGMLDESRKRLAAMVHARDPPMPPEPEPGLLIAEQQVSAVIAACSAG